MFETPPDEAVEATDLTLPGPAGLLGARLYGPAWRDPNPAHPRLRGDERNEDSSAEVARHEHRPGLIVYVHGGGWVAGGLATHDGVCRRLAIGSGLKVLAVDYRLAPEHPFPAALEDALAAVRWAGATAEGLGCDPARLVVAGDSAGAGLAAAVAQSADRPPVALQLLICPILNLAADSASRRAFAEGYFLDPATMAADLADYCGPAADRRDPRLSPLLAERLTGLPPALIHTAEYDPFRDEGEAYARRLRDAGVAVRQTRHGGMIHYFYALPRAIPYATEALAGIGAEIGSALAAG
jgi:acetyl esterase/lipase